MERLLIFLAVLIVVAIGAFVLRTASRNRRPPLQMDSEFLDEDTDLLIGPLSRRAGSPIDRSAETLDITPTGGPGPSEPRGEPRGERRDRAAPDAPR